MHILLLFQLQMGLGVEDSLLGIEGHQGIVLWELIWQTYTCIATDCICVCECLFMIVCKLAVFLHGMCNDSYWQWCGVSCDSMQVCGPTLIVFNTNAILLGTSTWVIVVI